MREQNHRGEQLPLKATRRRFLQLARSAIITALLAACGETPTVTPTPTRVRKPSATPTIPAIQIPRQPKPTQTETSKQTPPPEKTKTLTPSPDAKIINESGQEQINIPQETLDFLKNHIKDTGLSKIIKAVVIRKIDDPVFESTKDTGYPQLITGGGLFHPFALAKGFDKPKEGITLYLANSPLGKEAALHELGHAADASLNKAVELPISEFDNDYFNNHYKKYFENLPNDEPELNPYLFSYEKQIVMGTSIDLGQMLWENFFSAFESFPFGSTQFFIPDGELQTLSNSLPENSLQKQAVEWQMREIDRLKSKGQTPEIKGFTYDTWGRYLLRRYHENPDIIKQNLPQLYPEIKKIALQAFWLARQEVWADLWVERVLRPDNARQLYPFGVQTQEKLIKFLKTQQKYQNKAF